MKELLDMLVALVVESDDLDEGGDPDLILTTGTDIPRYNN